MARLIGPDAGSRLVYTLVGNSLAGAGGLTATVYADAGGTQLADILTYPGGVAISGSQLTVGSDSQLPLFQFPDSLDTVYVSVASGPVSPVYARTDDRLDALATSVAGKLPLAGGTVAGVLGLTGLLQAAMAPAGAMAAPLIKLTLDHNPGTNESDLMQVYQTDPGPIVRQTAWQNERGHFRAAQTPTTKGEHPYVSIVEIGATGQAFRIDQRQPDGSTRIGIGGWDSSARVMTSLQSWTAITTLDPGATGKYTIATTTGTSSGDAVDALGTRFISDDVVQFRGGVQVTVAGTTSGDILFTLASGVRPGVTRGVGVSNNSSAYIPVEIRSNGNVVCRRTFSGGSPVTLWFDGVTYVR